VIIAWAALAIGLALILDLGLGRFAPGATRFVDPLLLPLAAYALRRSQRSAMVVGCVSGLLQDYWTEPRLFGLNGLIKTILGWALGAFGARFDLNRVGGRFAAGASVHLVGIVLDAGIRHLFGEVLAPVPAWVLVVRTVLGGLLTAAVLAIVGRAASVRGPAKVPRRRA
jgi:rod shape-determining protein MreD